MVNTEQRKALSLESEAANKISNYVDLYSQYRDKPLFSRFIAQNTVNLRKAHKIKDRLLKGIAKPNSRNFSLLKMFSQMLAAIFEGKL